MVIDVDGKTLSLEDAFQEKAITIDQIRYFARQDAPNGFCKEIPNSQNGLCKFIYRYPEFDLWSIYDVYETPDGRKHLISELSLCAPMASYSPVEYYDPKTGIPIDYEDWGLIFHVIEATPNSMRIKCTHSGGQQIGDLSILNYELWTTGENGEDPKERIEKIADDFLGEYIPQGSILKEGTSEITIDFSPLYDELPPGDYILSLVIEDEYTSEAVRPLTKNFHDIQAFRVPFTVP